MECLHQLTADGQYGLRVDFSDFDGNDYWAAYDSFSVGSEVDKYRLRISGYDGNSTGDDSLTSSSGMMFSTVEQDNRDDVIMPSCAYIYGGGGGRYYIRDL